MRRTNVDRLVKLGMLAALSIVMMLLIHIQIIPAYPFLEYDMADVPILIGTFLYGPWWGLLLTLLVCVLQGITVSAGSGPIGVLMHFVATGAFAVVAGLIYKRYHTFKGALLALACGSVTMILLMIPLNLVFTGIFMGATVEAVAQMLLPAIIPFNAIKAVCNSAVTLLVYKSAGKVLRLELVRQHPASVQTAEAGASGADEKANEPAQTK